MGGVEGRKQDVRTVRQDGGGDSAVDITTYYIEKESLGGLLDEASDGRTQLPDFQRGWVWDDDHIKSLLASISVSFPIGAVMLLQTGGTGVRFKPRLLEGIDEHLCRAEPEALVLDGQQRLTSLYQALMNPSAVKTKDSKGKHVYRWYYIDMKLAVQPEVDWEYAVRSLPLGRQVKRFGGGTELDLTSPENEYEQDFFPTNKIFQVSEWRRSYNKFWEHKTEKVSLFDDFDEVVIKRFEQYQVPVIELKKETPKEAVCLVFERVNTGGVTLTVFELLTASFAAEDFQLRDDWNVREKRLKDRFPVLEKLQSDDFLQAISLLVSQHRRRRAIASDTAPERVPGISCKRKDILNLNVNDWRSWADQVEDGFQRGARFLHRQKIFKASDVPYRTQLVPLAAILSHLADTGEADGSQRKIARWYWCGVFGELYGGSTESRFARDLPEVVALVRDNSAAEPTTITEASFQAVRLLTLRRRNSSAYKGLYALLMRDGCLDFRTGTPIEAQSFLDEQIDIHHIFPESWCKKIASIDSAYYNSIINKTAISAHTNRIIGGRKPSKYLRILEQKSSIDDSRMDRILASHCIEPVHLRADDFWSFFNARAEVLLSRIATATGMSIAFDPKLFRASIEQELAEEGLKDWGTAKVIQEIEL